MILGILNLDTLVKINAVLLSLFASQSKTETKIKRWLFTVHFPIHASRIGRSAVCIQMQGKFVLKLENLGNLLCRFDKKELVVSSTATPFFEDGPRQWLAERSGWLIGVKVMDLEARAEIWLRMQETSAERCRR